MAVQEVEGKRVVVLLINNHEPGILAHVEDNETKNKPQGNNHAEETTRRLRMRSRRVAEQFCWFAICVEAHVVTDSPAARVPG